MGNNSGKLILIWTSGTGRNVIKRNFLSRALASPFVQSSRSICAILVNGIMGNNSLNLFLIWTSGSGGDII